MKTLNILLLTHIALIIIGLVLAVALNSIACYAFFVTLVVTLPIMACLFDAIERTIV